MQGNQVKEDQEYWIYVQRGVVIRNVNSGVGIHYFPRS